MVVHGSRMIIDSHVHIGNSEKLSRYFSFREYVEVMDRNGIDKAIVMPNVSSEIPWDVLNEEFMMAYHRIKDTSITKRFFLFLLADPRLLKTYVQIDMFGGFYHGLKFHPSITQVPVSDMRMHKFFDAALDRNWPVLVHCGRDPMSRISYLIEVAKRFPTKFIGAHLGGGASELAESAISEVRESELDNIWLDTSACRNPWLVEKAVDMLGADKILFGSDEPYTDMRVGKYLVEIADITDDERDGVFYKNVERLFECGA